MAYLEHNWRLSDAQAVTTAGTYVSTNSVDLQSIRDVGEGTPIYVQTQVTTADFAGEAGNVQIQVIAATNAALTSGKFILGSTGALSTAELSLYSQFFIPVGFFRKGNDNTIYAHEVSPTSVLNGQQYIGVQYVVAGGTVSGGKFTTRLTLETSTTPRVYPASTST